MVANTARLSWVDQSASPGTLRAEFSWLGCPGDVGGHHLSPGRLAPAVVRRDRGIKPGLRCGALHYTPSLGVFSAVTSASF
jgi:hypothetical protein